MHSQLCYFSRMKSLSKKLEAQLTALGATPFAIKVLTETARIPKGQTRSYSEIARAIGMPGAARAVGSALRNNPVPGTGAGKVPCHRVIRADGRIEGFMGSKVKGSKENLKKMALLKQEKAI